MSTSMDLRLWVRAPRMVMWSVAVTVGDVRRNLSGVHFQYLLNHGHSSLSDKWRWIANRPRRGCGYNLGMRLALGLLAAMLLFWPPRDLPGQNFAMEAESRVDSDSDGLSDALEQRLLEQFAPKFMVARDDCSGRPAEFVPDRIVPKVKVEDGTIYGQAFPVKQSGAESEIELHYYHLLAESTAARMDIRWIRSMLRHWS